MNGHEHTADDPDCHDTSCGRPAPSHQIHPYPAVRTLVAREVAAERERIAAAVERLADEWERGEGPTASDNMYADLLRALLAEYRGERPVPEDCDGSFICGARIHEHGCYADEAGFCNHPEDHDEPPKWADLFGAAPGINLCGEADEVTEDEVAWALYRARYGLAPISGWNNMDEFRLAAERGVAGAVLADFHVTRREATR